MRIVPKGQQHGLRLRCQVFSEKGFSQPLPLDEVRFGVPACCGADTAKRQISQVYDRSVVIFSSASQEHWTSDLDHDGPHALTAGVLAVGLSDLVEFEGGFYRHRNFALFEPVKKQRQVRIEVLRGAGDPEESGSLTRPNQQILC